MPLEISPTPGPTPVTEIDARTIQIIKAEGGNVVNHGDFSLVTFPPGTKHKKEQKQARPNEDRFIHRQKAGTLYRLPSGVILILSNHELSVNE